MGCARTCPRRWARKESVVSSPPATTWTRRVGTRVLVVPTLEQATWREQMVLDERSAVPVDPDGDPLQLAMLGINAITAYCLLHGYEKLAPGAWVAQTGASSATAGYVLALAKHAGLRTLNVVRRPESVEPLLDAGADVALVEGAGRDLLVLSEGVGAPCHPRLVGRCGVRRGTDVVLESRPRSVARS